MLASDAGITRSRSSSRTARTRRSAKLAPNGSSSCSRLKDSHDPGGRDAKSRAIVVPEQENFTAALEWASGRRGRSKVPGAAHRGPLRGRTGSPKGSYTRPTRWMKLVLENTESSSRQFAGQVLLTAADVARRRGEYQTGHDARDEQLALGPRGKWEMRAPSA